MALDMEQFSAEEQEIIDEALRGYQLSLDHCFAIRVCPDAREVVIVTNGGKRVCHRHGDQPATILSEADKTGSLGECKPYWCHKANGGCVPGNLNQRDGMTWCSKLNCACINSSGRIENP